MVKERSDADVHFCSLKPFFRFCFYLPVSGFKIHSHSAQCRGVRGEYTELNVARCLDVFILDNYANILLLD